jgi:hypothetical protein
VPSSKNLCVSILHSRPSAGWREAAISWQACVWKRAIVAIAPYVLHRPKMWGTRADEFDPARFLPGSREYIDRYAYLPFGAGARGCIGSIFALQEATLAVAAITQNFELEAEPNHAVWPVHRITLRPRGGLPMFVRRRAPGRPALKSKEAASV